MSIPPAKAKANKERFVELAKKPADEQLEFFLKSFIFALDDRWKDVVSLLSEFQKYVQRGGEGKPDLNFVQAAEFLQKQSKTRIAQQIKDELKDIDMDNNSRISFLEYLLIHFKVMVLSEFYKRHEIAPVEDLSNDGVGIVGVGDKLLDELFAPKSGLPPELVAAIEEFTAKKREKENKVKDLEAKAAAGGVKGAAAANELSQLQASDKTEFNRLEVTLNAAKRKAAKGSGDAALEAKKKKEEAERKKAEEEARQKMAERKKLWESGGGSAAGGDVKAGVTSFNKSSLKKTTTTDKSKPIIKAEVEEK
eukprot:Phypoly_transcript_12168.p1 GENE.Phypoly_transcript_12168~~Phypoly_transcript_12168.p1  ORF type:complete len:308 (+),score=111.53 Phypoly_transcript_12168:162-1085(+)